MKRLLLSIGASALGLGLLVGPVLSETGELIVPIVVSPSTINIESEGVWATVHAEIAYGDVLGFTVTLNDIPVVATKADARGEFVAKFCVDDVKDIVEPGIVELTLYGKTNDGVEFTGMDTVRVVQVSGSN